MKPTFSPVEKKTTRQREDDHDDHGSRSSRTHPIGRLNHPVIASNSTEQLHSMH